MGDLTQGIQLCRRFASNVGGTGTRSERRDLMALLLGLGCGVSLGIGAAFSLILKSNQAFVLVSMVSAGIVLPASRLSAAWIWRRLNTGRAYSRDIFQYREYLKDDYEEELFGIKSLPISNDDKERIVSARHEAYMQQRQEMRERISEERHRESQIGATPSLDKSGG
ncbi:MAG: hypothetical protein AABN34_09765 [Acidobacteriota bacterium]